MAGENDRPKNLPPERRNARFRSPEQRPRQEQPVGPLAIAQAEERDDEWEDLVAALRLHRRQLLRIPGATAVDVGYRLDETSGKFIGELALRVHVERKRPLEYFVENPQELISKSSKAPKKFADLKPAREYKTPAGKVANIDIIEANYRPAALAQPPRRGPVLESPRSRRDINRRRRLDPLVGGISIGNSHTPVGTLGALVWDKTDGTVCVLSNWHVLAGHLHAEVGSPCFQPGRFDQGTSNDVVARLKRWSFDRQTDAAIAELTGSRHYCAGEILELEQPISRTADPYLGMVVMKSGRSTKVTKGFVDGLYFSTAIEYSNGVVREFEDQIHIAPLPPECESDPILPISDSGDSGSIWVTQDSAGYLAVGLHFAGDLPRSAFGEYALANPIRIVQANLDFSFRPRFLEIRDEEAPELPAPSARSMQLQNGNGNGAHPVSIVVSGLTGPGGQPDPIPVGGGGGTGG